MLKELIARKKVTLKYLQSVTGALAFCCKAIPVGRAFLRRLYTSMIGVNKSYNFVRVSNGIREDALIWLDFLEIFNGRYSFPEPNWSSNDTLQLFTDSSNSAGGAYFQGEWSYIKWPKSWSEDILREMSFLELIPIVLAFSIWSTKLANKKVLLHTDNEALVPIINNKTSKSDKIMTLLRHLMFIIIERNIQIKAVHIPGAENKIADAISRLQWDRFRKEALLANPCPVNVPTKILTLLSQW
ncbi:hypothetical protein FSP39_012073 [Pinctada imbricata]|uniref:RNase H type-1 domain-containing protein n=1 Tax=Pinctada imbricata TaxID=66713 RepID=A0AA88XZ34_PINIB|nr:hypothetical protein FSP39_012073 [Pinctada imbricata]